jgi:hypothetical protein
LSEAFAVPQSDCCPIAKRIQKIVFSFVVLVSDPKAFDLVDQVIARFYEWALAIREKALGAEHPDTGTSLNNLANLLESQGDYVGAKPLYERALAIHEKALGAEHPDTGTSLNNLASLLESQGDYVGAKPLSGHTAFFPQVWAVMPPIRSCTPFAFSVSSHSSESFGRIKMRGFLISPLVVFGKGLKLTRNR